MPERYFYTAVQSAGFVADRPLLPMTLILGNQRLSAIALLDSGADINVLPYELGLQLGASWEAQTTAVTGLSGNLANYEARGLVVRAGIGDFPTVRLAFAWTRVEGIPLLLGQTNFFAEFKVCFFRAQNFFEIEPK
jgi:hypothetical protein